jgi:hypothetical protein
MKFSFLALLPITLVQAHDNERVKVQLSAEALCPDCINYSVTQIRDLMTKIPEIVELEVLPFGNGVVSPNNGTDTDLKWQFDCQHGINECTSNMLIACVIEHYPLLSSNNTPEWYPFYDCMEDDSTLNKNRDGPYNLKAAESCATQANIDWMPIQSCAGEDPSKGSSKDGNLLMHSIALATPNHTYVPWVVINDKTVPDDGSGYPAGDLTTMVCEAYGGAEKPGGCY